RTSVLLVVVVLAFAAGGCSQEPDPAAFDASGRVDYRLRTFFPQLYAGVEVDDDGRIIVYRKPGDVNTANVEVAARDEVGKFKVEFRDARFSVTEMNSLADRVAVDLSYWREQRSFHVEGVTTRVDGAGVNVVVGDRDLDRAKREFRDRYGDDEPVFVLARSRGGVGPAGY
ncbi:MAG TPA: hypothetical protein VF062_07995, partial [Candidatus Limnocylindrales bacterium]